MAPEAGVVITSIPEAKMPKIHLYMKHLVLLFPAVILLCWFFLAAYQYVPDYGRIRQLVYAPLASPQNANLPNLASFQMTVRRRKELMRCQCKNLPSLVFMDRANPLRHKEFGREFE